MREVQMRWLKTLCVRCQHIRTYHLDAGCDTFTSDLAQRGGLLGIIGIVLDAAQRLSERRRAAQILGWR
jgi:hypothetical protein